MCQNQKLAKCCFYDKYMHENKIYTLDWISTWLTEHKKVEIVRNLAVPFMWRYHYKSNNYNTWLISLIQAAFSCMVGATKCTTTCGNPVFTSMTILKSRLWRWQLPLEVSLIPLDWLDIEQTDDSVEKFNAATIITF